MGRTGLERLRRATERCIPIGKSISRSAVVQPAGLQVFRIQTGMPVARWLSQRVEVGWYT